MRTQKFLAYCAFLHAPNLSLPAVGVSGTDINVLEHDRVHLLWSDVEWPFDSSALQQRAIEFHQVIHHLFRQAAVVPFRLLSLFDSHQHMTDFIARHGASFTADLDRLRNVVQMECVIFFKSLGRPDLSSGSVYLQQKASLKHALDEFAESLKPTLSTASEEVRIREVNNGKRIYCRVQRGQEDLFKSRLQEVVVPGSLERRITGPWPASEFLTDSVKMPEVAGQR